jgi:hypothetical protein
MAPVIRIDDEVLGELKKRAIALGLVFSTPNDVLRVILRIDVDGNGASEESENTIDVQLKTLYTPHRWALIPIPKGKRHFFPGYKVNFELITDVGVLTAHVTSAPKGTPRGDPDGGKYVQGGLRLWYDKHPELKDGARLRIEALEPGKRYKLCVA